jgi:hypothetical protein
MPKQEEGQFDALSGYLRGVGLPPTRVAAPFLPSQRPTQNDKGKKMLFDRDQYSTMQEVNILAEAAARTGFALSDIEALAECELETGHVLDYIGAVISNRMN